MDEDRNRPAGRTAATPRLRPLGRSGSVRITGGPLAERVQDALETYLSLPVDDVLHGFRRQAGLPAPGRPMTGWASTTSESTFGQWVSGLARTGVSAGEPQAVDRARELVDGWWRTVGAGRDHRMSGYGIEKVVCGIVDLVELAGHDDLLDLVEPIAAASSAAFGRERPPGSAVDFEGGILAPTRTLEWYTFAESFYRAWRLGAPDSVRDFAAEWHYDAYWDRFAAAPPPGAAWDVPPWLHAYSHLNTFASVAQLYAVEAAEHWLTVLRNAHTYFTTTQLFATGGYGPGELTVPEDGTLGRSLEWRTDSAEIVCGSWAAFKLCAALVEHTGEARYGDWVEQLLHSGIGAVTPVTAQGRSPYYQDYRLGTATELPHWDDWPCCSGTYLQNVGHMPDTLYGASDDGLAVLQYVPSVVEWEHEGRSVRVEQRTRFPVEDTSELRVQADGPVRMALRLRVPAWTAGFSVRVDDAVVDQVAAPGRWFVLDRVWHPGEVVRVVLGATLRMLPVDRQHPERVAFAHGPVVLAQPADWTSPVALQTPSVMVDLQRAFVREEGLRYRPVGPGTGRLPQGPLVPLADIPQRHPHRVYFDVGAPRII